MQGVFKSATSTDCNYPYVEGLLTEASECAFAAADLMQGALDTLVVKTDVMRQRAGAFWGTASNLADEIVRSCNLSFRTAHHVVGRLVRIAVAEKLPPEQITAAHLAQAARETIGRPLDLSDKVIRLALDPVQFIMSRSTLGSVNPAEGERMVADGTTRLAGHVAWLAAKNKRIEDARAELKATVTRYSN
jgi:argininosuccinate lyase